MKMILFFAVLTVLLCSCNHNTQKENNQDLLPLDKLKAGNERFVKGQPVHPDETLERVRELKKRPTSICSSNKLFRLPGSTGINF